MLRYPLLLLLSLFGLLCQGFLVTRIPQPNRRSSLAAVPSQGSPDSSGPMTATETPADVPPPVDATPPANGTTLESSGDFFYRNEIADSIHAVVDHSEQQTPDTPTPRPSPSLSRRPKPTRRDFLQQTAMSLCGSIVVGGTAIIASTTHPSIQPIKKKDRRLAPVNFTLVVQETKVNITEETIRSLRFLDPTTFQKKETLKLPSWVPSFIMPTPRVIKETSNAEILTAAILAGSLVEMSRTTILYPLLTLKTRIQTDITRRERKRRRRRRQKPLWDARNIKRRLQILQLNVRKHFSEGDLYAGLVPSLLVAVPATGVYFGVRDVVKRTLTPLALTDLAVAVTAALVADVVSLILRTPADTLAIRLQVASGIESHHHHDNDDDSRGNERMKEHDRDERINEAVGNWFVESIERLPAVILTDLPYLLLRTMVNGAVINGALDLGHYEILAISTAILCGILTTPFDVARTRILMDSDNDPDNGIDGGSGEGLLRTFQTIIRESDDGVANLFRGWFERTAYLGIGRAWLEPLQIIGYMAIRDAILLEWFD